MKSIISVFLIAVAHAIACNAQVEQTKTFAKIRSLRITMQSGNCELQKSTDGAISVRVQFDDANGLTPYMLQERDKLSIKEDVKDVNGKRKLKMIVAVPDHLSVTFFSISGKLLVNDLSVQFQGTSDAGALSFKKVTGDLDISIVSGDLDIEDFSGTVNARMGSGRSHISGSTGEVRITSEIGQIVASESKAKFRLESKNGNVVGRNITLDGSSRFTTVAGNAEVQLKVTPIKDLLVSSGAGDALVGFNGNKVEGKIIMRAGKQSGSINAPFLFEREEEIEYGRIPTMQKTTQVGKAKNHIQVNTASGEAILTF